MAEIKLLAQGLIENNDHLSAVNQLLHLEDANEILISVAFVRKSGIVAISDALSSKKDITNLYIGIRNGVTSIQAILEILKLGIHPYIIDVATTKRLYHPKIYAAFSYTNVELILGSANLTITGLNHNYEASSYISLDTSIESDKQYIISLKNAFCELEKRFPNNVIKISTVKEAVKLFRDGLLEDERIIKLPTTKKIKSHRSSTPRKPMPSMAIKIIATPKLPVTKNLKNKFSNNYILVWESKELTERDLNIPKGNNTNATGSMFFSKGYMKDIDQRHYFRNDVFDKLTWIFDSKPNKQHLERATADFEIVISGISYGVHTLKLTHDTDTTTKTYAQNNSMTRLHWGEVKQLVAKPELLGNRAILYRLGDNTFILSIS
jgi:HKD family nuclease